MTKLQKNMYLFAYFVRCAVNQNGQNDVIKFTLSHCWTLWGVGVGDLPVNGDSPHKGPVLCSFGKSFAVGLNKQLSKQSSYRWYVIPLLLLGIWTLHWRHNGYDGVSNHQPHDCLLNRLFRRRSKKTSKFRVTGPCVGNSPVTGEFAGDRWIPRTNGQ